MSMEAVSLQSDYKLRINNSEIADLSLDQSQVQKALLKLTFGFGLTLDSLIKSKYDFDNIADNESDKWKNDSSKLDTLKKSFRGLARAMQNDEVFSERIDECLGKFNENRELYSKVFKNIVYVRHFLRRCAIIAFIALKIHIESKELSTLSNKLEQLQHLRTLLKDSTNILLNLDVVPSSEHVSLSVSIPPVFDIHNISFGNINIAELVESQNKNASVSSPQPALLEVVNEEAVNDIMKQLPNTPQAISPKSKNMESWADIVEEAERVAIEAFEEANRIANEAIKSATGMNASSTIKRDLVKRANIITMLHAFALAAFKKAQEINELAGPRINAVRQPVEVALQELDQLAKNARELVNKIPK